MASLFISHSREDDELAKRLADLLSQHRYTAFLDHDPHEGIPGGRKWEDELFSKLRSSQAVIFLSTAQSIGSPWCFAELVVARSIHKPIVPLSVEDAHLDLLDDLQWIPWDEGETARERLRLALESLEIEALPYDPSRPPYPGLEAFGEDDAGIFFGRKPEVVTLMEYLDPPQALEPKRFVAVTGASGSGKSSLVQAGLIPRLRLTGRWVVLRPMLPLDGPFEELARALQLQAGSQDQTEEIYRRIKDNPKAFADLANDLRATLPTRNGKVLLIIDQAEELVRIGEAGRDFLDFLADALSASRRLWVVITIRSESISAVLGHPKIADLIGPTMVLGPLHPSRLVEVVKRPGDRAGVQFEERIVERMVAETEGGDALPLLAYTLRQLYERSLPRKVINEDLYDQIGGVLGALKDRADRLLEAFEQQDKAELVLPTLVQLVELNLEGEATRRRVALAEFGADEQRILYAFVEQRLLKTSQASDGSVTVEAVHEALFRAWTPLAEAVKRSEDELRTRSELDRLAREWDLRGRLNSYLITEDRLERARRFLAGSPRARADVGLIVEYVERSEAYQEEREEQMRRLSGEVRSRTLQARLRAQAEEAERILDIRPVQSLALAIRAAGLNLQEMPEEILGAVRSSLRHAVEGARERNVLAAHAATVTSVATSPNGSLIASAGNDATLRLWDGEGNEVGRPLEGHTDRVLAVAFSPDGRGILSGGADGSLRLWNLDGEQLWEASGHGDAVTSLGFSRDGRWIVSGSDDRTLRLWDPHGEPIGAPLEGHREFVSSLAISPDGRIVASAGGDGIVLLWERNTCRLLHELAYGEEVVVTSLALSPDGERLLCGGSDGEARFFDLRGSVLARLEGHEDWVSAVAFAQGGERVVTASADRTLRLWDLEGAPVCPPLRGHEGIVTTVALTADGEVIVSGSADGTVRLWDAEGLLLSRFRGHTSDANGVTFARGGRVFATVGADRKLCLWDLGGTRIAEREEHGNFIHAVASSLSGDRLASGDADGRLVVWDGRGRLLAGPLPAHRGPISSVAFSPEGTALASGGADGVVRLWNLDGRQAGSLEGHGGAVYAVDFAPDGMTLASGGADGTVRLWDLRGAPPLLIQASADSVFAVAFSPDGTTVASGGTDGVVRLWDLEGKPAGSLEGHSGAVYSVDFAPDGTTLASSGADGTVRLWDLKGIQVGPEMRGLDGAIACVRFNPDGEVLAAAGASGRIAVWRASDWRSWLELACRRLQHHPAFRDPEDEIDREACDTCNRQVFQDAQT